MLEKNNQKLTLDISARYEVKVPGYLDQTWSDWVDNLETITNTDSDGRAVTSLIGTFDQAALIGLLRRLYSLGIPLISVIWLDSQ